MSDWKKKAITFEELNDIYQRRYKKKEIRKKKIYCGNCKVLNGVLEISSNGVEFINQITKKRTEILKSGLILYCKFCGEEIKIIVKDS